MTKYQLLISKIKKLKNEPCSNLSLTELELIQEALETIQVLEIIFRMRAAKNQPKDHV